MLTTVHVTVISVVAFAIVVSAHPNQIWKRQTSTKCTSDLDLSPCTCVSTPNDVKCDNIDDKQLKQAFAGKAKSSLDNLLIDSNTLTSLPAGVFGSISFKTIYISRTKLQNVEDGSFQGSEDTLENILLSLNSFKNFNFKALKNLKKLTSFELSNDGLTTIPSEGIGSIPFLQFIVLSNNSISSIAKNAFAELPSIKSIDLHGNKLTSIEEGVFSTSKAKEAVKINLASNQIKTIEKNAFKDVKVGLLDLEDNQLETLDQDVFEPFLDSLSKETTGLLHVKGNPFKCDSSIKWLLSKPATYKRRITNFQCKDGKKLQQLKQEDLKS